MSMTGILSERSARRLHGQNDSALRGTIRLHDGKRVRPFLQLCVECPGL